MNSFDSAFVRARRALGSRKHALSSRCARCTRCLPRSTPPMPPPAGVRIEFDDIDEQWWTYTTQQDDETPKMIARKCASQLDEQDLQKFVDEVVDANRKRHPGIKSNSRLKIATCLKFAPVEENLLCSTCKHDEFPGQPIICCEGRCSRGYHPQCLGLDKEPDGPWRCNYCSDADVQGADA